MIYKSYHLQECAFIHLRCCWVGPVAELLTWNFIFLTVFTEILFNKNKGYKYLGCIVLYIVVYYQNIYMSKSNSPKNISIHLTSNDDLVLAMTFWKKKIILNLVRHQDEVTDFTQHHTATVSNKVLKFLCMNIKRQNIWKIVCGNSSYISENDILMKGSHKSHSVPAFH